MNKENIDGLVSIIVPVYNREKTLSTSVKSALDQSYKMIEVLIIDDCSTDNSLKVAHELSDPRVRVITLKLNQGPGHARNVGISQASGEWIAFLDSDDLWSVDRLEVLLANIHHGEMIADFVDFIRVVNGNKIPVGCLWNEKDLELINKNNNLLSLECYLQLSRLTIQPVIPRTFIKKYGIKQTEVMYAEDSVYYMKLLKKGLKLRIIPRVMYYYLRVDKSLSSNIFRAEIFVSEYLKLKEEFALTENESRYLDVRINDMVKHDQYLKYIYCIKNIKVKCFITKSLQKPWLFFELLKRVLSTIIVYFKRDRYHIKKENPLFNSLK